MNDSRRRNVGIISLIVMFIFKPFLTIWLAIVGVGAFFGLKKLKEKDII